MNIRTACNSSNVRVVVGHLLPRNIFHPFIREKATIVSDIDCVKTILETNDVSFGVTLIYAKYLSVYVFFYNLFHCGMGGVVHI